MKAFDYLHRCDNLSEKRRNPPVTSSALNAFYSLVA